MKYSIMVVDNVNRKYFTEKIETDNPKEDFVKYFLEYGLKKDGFRTYTNIPNIPGMVQSVININHLTDEDAKYNRFYIEHYRLTMFCTPYFEEYPVICESKIIEESNILTKKIIKNKEFICNSFQELYDFYINEYVNVFNKYFKDKLSQSTTGNVIHNIEDSMYSFNANFLNSNELVVSTFKVIDKKEYMERGL